MLVSPKRGGHLRYGLNLSDHLLGASKLFGLVHGVHSVEDGAGLDRLEVFQEVSVTLSNGSGEVKLRVGLETERPREVGVL